LPASEISPAIVRSAMPDCASGFTVKPVRPLKFAGWRGTIAANDFLDNHVDEFRAAVSDIRAAATTSQWRQQSC